MSERTIRDWMILIGGFHFFMAILALVASAAVFIYAVLPPIDAGNAIAQDLFIPVVGVIVGLIVSGVYILVGFGVIQLRNLARMISIFLAAFAVLGGFIAVIGSIASNVIGAANPDYISVLVVSLATICFYTLVSFMNIFVLIFLFIPQVRLAFYGITVEDADASLTDPADDNESLPEQLPDAP